MELLSQSHVKTRKPHQCWGCAQVFPSGTKMARVTTKDGDYLVTVYWCQHCDEILAEHRHELDPGDDGLGIGDVAEFEREYLAAQETPHAN